MGLGPEMVGVDVSLVEARGQRQSAQFEVGLCVGSKYLGLEMGYVVVDCLWRGLVAQRGGLVKMVLMLDLERGLMCWLVGGRI